MNTLDIVFCSIVGFLFLMGFSKGSLKELLSLGGVVISYIVAGNLYMEYEHIAAEYIKSPNITEAATYLGIFIITYLACAIAGFLIRLLFASKSPTITSRTLGGIFGFFRGIVFSLIILFIARNYIPAMSDSVSGSKLAPYLSEIWSKVIESGLI